VRRSALLLGFLAAVIGCQKIEQMSKGKTDPPPEKAEPTPEPKPAAKQETPAKPKEKQQPDESPAKRQNPLEMLVNLGRVDVKKIDDDYMQGLETADTHYKNKAMTIAVTAHVTHLNPTNNLPTVAMSTVSRPGGLDAPNYYFHFGSEDIPVIRNMKIGTTYNIECRCIGYRIDNTPRGGLATRGWRVVFDQCRVLD
jgi:hypothetical protein